MLLRRKMVVHNKKKKTKKFKREVFKEILVHLYDIIINITSPKATNYLVNIKEVRYPNHKTLTISIINCAKQGAIDGTPC